MALVEYPRDEIYDHFAICTEPYLKHFSYGCSRQNAFSAVIEHQHINAVQTLLHRPNQTTRRLCESRPRLLYYPLVAVVDCWHNMLSFWSAISKVS